MLSEDHRALELIGSRRYLHCCLPLTIVIILTIRLIKPSGQDNSTSELAELANPELASTTLYLNIEHVVKCEAFYRM